MKKELYYRSEDMSWSTPIHVFDQLDKEFDFKLDPCATRASAKCDRYFTIEDDGLAQDWDETTFMNPPYGKQIKHWIKKAYEESLKGTTVVCLIPARVDTLYWHDTVFNKATEIRFVKGRIKFGGGKNGAPFPSAVVIYKPPINEEPKETLITTMEFKEAKKK